MDEFDGRKITNETIKSNLIKKGDAVIEGNFQYRVLTDVQGTYWEYFDLNDGYYSSTSPECCLYLVVGQKNAGGKLIKIKM